MPVLLRRPTYERLVSRAEEADVWREQAGAAVADAGRVLDAVDVSMRALATVHQLDTATGLCTGDGKPYPCPTGEAVAALVGVWTANGGTPPEG